MIYIILIICVGNFVPVKLKFMISQTYIPVGRWLFSKIDYELGDYRKALDTLTRLICSHKVSLARKSLSWGHQSAPKGSSRWFSDIPIGVYKLTPVPSNWFKFRKFSKKNYCIGIYSWPPARLRGSKFSLQEVRCEQWGLSVKQYFLTHLRIRTFYYIISPDCLLERYLYVQGRRTHFEQEWECGILQEVAIPGERKLYVKDTRLFLSK